jgi:hypothetical protein
MPVSINMPQRQQQADPLEKLAMALNIAKTGFGIAADMKTLESAKQEKIAKDKLVGLQTTALENEQKGILTGEKRATIMKDLVPAKEGEKNAFMMQYTGPQGTPITEWVRQAPKEPKVRDPLAEEMAQVRLEEAKAKKGEREEKKQTLVREVEDRRQNIKDAVELLKKKIGDDGTWELLGSHNQDIDRIVDGIATDMAKLQDPQSVARPSEVELVKTNLIQSGFKNANSTAVDVLNNFSTEVDRRADTAYKVRGLEIPAMAKSPGGGAEFVQMISPKGEVKNVPKAQVDAALASGGKLFNPANVAKGN